MFLYDNLIYKSSPRRSLYDIDMDGDNFFASRALFPYFASLKYSEYSSRAIIVNRLLRKRAVADCSTVWRYGLVSVFRLLLRLLNI